MAKERTVGEKEVLVELGKQRRMVVEQIFKLEKMLKNNKDWAISPEQMEMLTSANKKYTAAIQRVHLR
tara:strand:+ start:382 stop:585 length:204 start_codon:yes stop_codon:yes gene_type:complete